VDFLRKLQDAERRPTSGRFDAGEHTFGGRSLASLVVPAESRLTWTIAVPHRARLRLLAAVPATNGEASIAFRVGISDERLYNTLVELPVSSAETAARGWVPVEADLSRFAGWHWSLFYRPDSRLWKIVIGTHVLSGDPPAAYLGIPALMTDAEGAREYLARTTRRARRR
jgi:hypothetical protein